MDITTLTTLTDREIIRAVGELERTQLDALAEQLAAVSTEQLPRRNYVAGVVATALLTVERHTAWGRPRGNGEYVQSCFERRIRTGAFSRNGERSRVRQNYN